MTVSIAQLAQFSVLGVAKNIYEAKEILDKEWWYELESEAEADYPEQATMATFKDGSFLRWKKNGIKVTSGNQVTV